MNMVNKLILLVIIHGGFQQVLCQDYAKPMIESVYQKCIEDTTREYLDRVNKDLYPSLRDREFKADLKKCHDGRNHALAIISDILGK